MVEETVLLLSNIQKLRKLCCFFQIFRNHTKYLFNFIPTSVRPYTTRNANNNNTQFKVKHNFFQNSGFFSVVIEQNKLDQNIHNSENLNIFKKRLLKFVRPSGNSVFSCHNPKVKFRVKLLTRLGLGLGHLWEHKFKHGFLDSFNPIRSCGQDTETSNFLLHCSNYSNERLSFLNLMRNIDGDILNQNELKVMETLPYGDSSLEDTNNTLIMNATIEFLIAFKRFDVPLVQVKCGFVYSQHFS